MEESMVFSQPGMDAELVDGDDVLIVEGIQGGYFLMLALTAEGFVPTEGDIADCRLYSATDGVQLSLANTIPMYRLKADGFVRSGPVHFEIFPEDERTIDAIHEDTGLIHCDYEDFSFDLEVILNVDPELLTP